MRKLRKLATFAVAAIAVVVLMLTAVFTSPTPAMASGDSCLAGYEPVTVRGVEYCVASTEIDASIAASVPAGSVTTTGTLTLSWYNPLPAAPVNGEHQFIECPAMLAGVPLVWVDGQCKLSSETPVWVGQIPNAFRAMSASGIYYPCKPAGMHSGLSLRVDDPAKILVPNGDPRARNEFTGYVPPACPNAPMADPRGEAMSTDPTEVEAEIVMPEGYTLDDTGEAQLGCGPVEGFTMSDIEGGWLYKSTTKKDFVVPDGCKAMWGDPAQWYAEGYKLEKVTQVSAYLAE